MRILTLIFALAFSVNHSLAQNDYLNFILNSEVQLTEAVDTRDQRDKILLRTDYAQPQILNPKLSAALKDRTVLKIDLVYTSYRQVQSFDQRELNRERLQELQKLLPELFQNYMIEWNLVAQTGCASPGQGNDFFHGFVIHCRPLPTTAKSDEEISYLKEILKKGESEKSGSKKVPCEETITESTRVSVEGEEFTKLIDEMPVFRKGNRDVYLYISKTVIYPKDALRKGVEGTVVVGFDIDREGAVQNVKLLKSLDDDCDNEALRVVRKMPDWEAGKLDGKAVRTSFTLPIHFVKSEEAAVATSLLYAGAYKDKTALTTITYKRPCKEYHISDSTVLNVLERNKQWKNMAVVCDFTGSMSPYTAQLLVWFKLNEKTNGERIKSFTFFNDGDRTPNSNKKVGKVGGIYHEEAGTFKDVENLAFKTMRNGNGGDCPENNIEAVLEAMDKCPDCDEVVMIADNFATPRDLSLLKKVGKPVRVILCGTFGGINVEYMNMVRENGGSLHIIEEDIWDLMELNEGDEMEVGKRSYKIENGKFVPVYNS